MQGSANARSLTGAIPVIGSCRLAPQAVAAIIRCGAASRQQLKGQQTVYGHQEIRRC
jgi:hypothetical protein